jgi:sugar lactone lactonase YvrE
MRFVLVTPVVVLGFIVGCQQSSRPTVSSAENRSLDAVQLARAEQGPENSVGRVEPVAMFEGPSPTGVAVSREGRIFVCFPRWDDPVDFTVAELVNGQAVAYPNSEVNKLDTNNPSAGLVSVQSVVIDAKDRLWVLDTGSINFQPPMGGAAKLICYDLQTNQEVRRITFPDTALSTSYLNDVRFNLDMGTDGMAFITDSSDKGPNAIIVADLATGKSWRRLEGSPWTKADRDFVPSVEGKPLMSRPANQPPATLQMGCDGIAISPDGKTLYFCPLASTRIYSVSTAQLADPDVTDDDVNNSVQPLPERDYASDGLETDQQGFLYLTDYEHNAIHRCNPDGSADQVIAQDPRMIWPDSMCASDGYLYFTCNQLNRQPRFHEGKDLRQQPYVLLRTRIGEAAASAQF